MFIFICSKKSNAKSDILIYIPLCLYLYSKSLIFFLPCTWFTFHYVYIYMSREKVFNIQRKHLHSTMFIFIFKCENHRYRRCVYLHSTMFIFISDPILAAVSPAAIYIPLCLYLYAFRSTWLTASGCIYIPLCLYLYRYLAVHQQGIMWIYIPLCLYLYNWRPKA